MESPPASRNPSWLVLSLLLLTCTLEAQITVFGHAVEVHGFFSQGTTKSDQNNYLTMNTSDGDFHWIDGGGNISTRVTDKLRVGAQVYARKLGKLGNGHPLLDWASADYRFSDYFGIRAGRVKTVLGLYNDTQDLEFLHTWAIIPQSLYPLDLRGLYLSHDGADIYGSLSRRNVGTFSYTVYAGRAPDDPSGGREFAYKSFGIDIKSGKRPTRGFDVKWSTPADGLVLGLSAARLEESVSGYNPALAGNLTNDSTSNTIVVSAQYSRKRLHLDYERARQTSYSVLSGAHGMGPGKIVLPYDQRGWYASIAYRFGKHIEVGSYHSRFYPNSDKQPPFQQYHPAEARHMYDQVFTARLDIHPHWDLKVEGHVIEGYGDPSSSRGFYTQDNPGGFLDKTRMLVIRLGANY